jgi:hypothetical protein
MQVIHDVVMAMACGTVSALILILFLVCDGLRPSPNVAA